MKSITQLSSDVLFIIFSYDSLPHLASCRLVNKFFSQSITRFFSEWIQEVTLWKEVKLAVIKRFYSLRKLKIEYNITQTTQEDNLVQGLKYLTNLQSLEMEWNLKITQNFPTKIKSIRINAHNLNNHSVFLFHVINTLQKIISNCTNLENLAINCDGKTPINFQFNVFPYLHILSLSNLTLTKENLDSLSLLKFTKLSFDEVNVTGACSDFWKNQKSLNSLHITKASTHFSSYLDMLQVQTLTKLSIIEVSQFTNKLNSLVARATNLIELGFIDSGTLECDSMQHIRFPYLNHLRLDSVSSVIPGMFPSITSLRLDYCVISNQLTPLLRYVSDLELTGVVSQNSIPCLNTITNGEMLLIRLNLYLTCGFSLNIIVKNESLVDATITVDHPFSKITFLDCPMLTALAVSGRTFTVKLGNCPRLITEDYSL